MPNPSVRVRITAVRALSPSVRCLSLLALEPSESLGSSAPGAGLPQFEAGQWLHLHVPAAGGSEKRAYSIASGPGQWPIELAVTHVSEGVVSPLLHSLVVGDELTCDGPYGFFTRDGALKAAPALFVGTGTGLAPLRSMLLAELADSAHLPITLLFGVRSEADILWRDELESWARNDKRFRLEVTLSRPTPAWTGRTGYVQTHVAELARALGEPHVFVCGLSPMISAVRSLCKTELAYDRKHIHSERYD